MGTKNSPGQYDCYQNAEPDEPMFVLLARDKYAPLLVRMWAEMRQLGGEQNVDTVAEALHCAKKMREWRRLNR